jgi:hypothetical protein
LRALVGIAFLAGCFKPSFENGRTKCSSSEPTCPAGYYCDKDVRPPACWQNGTGPDLAGVVFDLSLLVGDMPGVPPHVTVQVSPDGQSMHQDATLSMTATLSNLLPADTSPTATFSSSGGSFNGLVCSAPQNTSVTCTANFVPSALGDAIITATSFDGATGQATVTVIPPLSVTFSPPRLDLLAFSGPLVLGHATATANNLLPGESSVVTLSATGNTAYLALSGAMVTASPPPVLFPIQGPSPSPAMVHAALMADPTRSADLPVVFHAWVDESPPSSLLGTVQATLWSAAIAPNGDLMVGGRKATPSPSPIALLHTAATGQWTTALSGFNGQPGAITSVAVDDSGQFVLAGVTGGFDGWQNQSLLLLHCGGTPQTCATTNLASLTAIAPASATPDAFGLQSTGVDLSLTTNPHVVTFKQALTGTPLALILSSSKTGGMCGPGGGSSAANDQSYYLKLDGTGSLARLTWKDELSGMAPNTSCPFSTSTGDSRYFTGGAVSADGSALWLGGFANCNTTNCSVGVQPFDALLQDTPPAGPGWTTYQTQAGAAGLDGPVVKLGYDGSLLAISSLITSNNLASLMWFDSAASPMQSHTCHIAQPGGAIDVGLTVAGAAGGGSPWAAGQPDLFFSIIRKVATTESFHVGWQFGTSTANAQLVQTAQSPTNSGFQILDFAFARTPSGVEGWGVGHAFGPGAVRTPLVIHLR